MDFVQPMMELLKLLGTLGAYSLAVAITAIVGILIFKLTQLLSILLLIKYGITRLFDWMTARKVTIVEHNKTVVLDKQVITHTDEGNADRLLAALERVKKLKYASEYLHKHHIDMLEEAVTWLEEKYGDQK